MAYIGKNLVGVLKENRTVVTSTGDGSTSLELNETPGSVNNVLVFLDGIRQQPTTDYTVSGSMLTFTTGPETGVKIVAIVGNHSGVEPKKGSVTTRKIVDGAVTGQKLADGNIPTSKFSGALPALDGSNLLGVHSDTIHKSPNDPAINTNTIDGQTVTLGQMWVNTTSGEMYICTDVTENAQHWMNVGAGEGDYTNVPPTNPTNTGTFQDITESSSQTFIFDGATDADGSVTHYMVDNILPANGVLTVSAAEVAATTAHTFNTGAVGSDTAVTFRVRSKDNNGVYSSGVTVSMNVTNLNYIAATGGSTSPIGDYMYHTFTGNSSFNVTAVPSNSNSTIDYLVVGGGGGGGNARGGGGGAGGYVASSLTISTGSFGVTIGGGGGGGSNANYVVSENIGDVGSPTSVSGLGIATATGGGGGGTCNGNSYQSLRNGASGGGGGGNSGYNGGTSTSQGNNGGNCTNSGGHGRSGAGGGGAGSAGGHASFPNSGDGGNGTTWLNGSTYAGGGGGGTGGNASQRGQAGTGGGGIGGWGYRTNSSQTSGANCGHGTQFTGGGGGGDGYEAWNLQNGNGGDGVVIFRYKYQN